jgi:hypothetical protein
VANKTCGSSADGSSADAYRYPTGYGRTTVNATARQHHEEHRDERRWIGTTGMNASDHRL